MRAVHGAAVVVLCVASGAIGWLGGVSSAPVPVSANQAAQASDEAPHPLAVSRPARTPRVRTPVVDEADELDADADSRSPEAISHALPAHANDETIEDRLAAITGGEINPARVADVASRSRARRARSLAAADNADQVAIRQVAEEILKERAFLADAARGGTMQMLRELGNKSVRMFDLVGDRTAFAAHFERKETGPIVDGPSWKRADTLAHGTTLRFPAGQHTWSVRSFRSAKTFPRDLVVEGAGMNTTLVRLDELDVSADVTNLTFRDCTIDCGDDYFTDLHSDAPITLRLERCRVIGFDMGAGGSVMLSANTAAFFATDCRFEAGYGRTRPGFGNLFRVRDGLLVRCGNCVFRGPFRSVFDTDSAATYVFSACRFERMNSRFAGQFAAAPAGVRFESCTATEPLDSRKSLENRPLSDFNPAWPSKPR